jgi:ATP-dependent Clp protease protease subunit
MMEKLNRELNQENLQHNYFVIMDEIATETLKPAIEWIVEANFSQQRPDVLTLILCSPGGELDPAFALIDMMRGSSIPVRTIGLGQIASAALLIFMSGKKGERILTPNTSVMSHQYTWGTYGKAHELMATAKQFDVLSQKLIRHYKKCTELDEEKIRNYLLPPQDVWLSAQESLKLGLCDIVKDLK